MKKSTKALLILLAIGITGIAVTMGIAIGTGIIMSREDMQTYAISEPFDTLVLNTTLPVELAVSNDARVEVYAKAWLPQPIELCELVDYRVESGVLIITETPLAPKFFGFFPQPYELKITLHLPQQAYEAITGGKK